MVLFQSFAAPQPFGHIADVEQTLAQKLRFLGQSRKKTLLNPTIAAD